MTLGWLVPWDVNMCTSYSIWGEDSYFGGGGFLMENTNGKQSNFHSVSFDNVGGAFVSFDTFLVVNCPNKLSWYRQANNY